MLKKQDQIAFLIHQRQLYFSAAVSGELGQSAFLTPVIKLIGNIYARWPNEARGIVRNRVFTNYKLTEACYGLIRVAAKRLSPIAEYADFLEHRRQAEQIFDLSQFEFEATAGSADNSLQAETALEPPVLGQRLSLERALKKTWLMRDQSPHLKISALILSDQGEVLAFGQNQSRSNKIMHAEMQALLGYQFRLQTLLPRGAQVICSRKPCKMCAGMIWHASEEPLSVKVHYIEDDAGPMARETVLDTHSRERRRACASLDDVARKIQFVSSTAQ